MSHLDSMRERRRDAFRSLDAHKGEMLSVLEAFRRDASPANAEALADHARLIGEAAATVANLDRRISRAEAALIEEGFAEKPKPLPPPRYRWHTPKKAGMHVRKMPEGAIGGSGPRRPEPKPTFDLRVHRVVFHPDGDGGLHMLTKVTVRGRDHSPLRLVRPRVRPDACHVAPAPRRRAPKPRPASTVRDRTLRYAVALASAEANRAADAAPTPARRVLAWIDVLETVAA